MTAPVQDEDRERAMDVHTEHCCARHGCKYGDDDCTVYALGAAQSVMCESCYYDIWDEGGWESAQEMNGLWGAAYARGQADEREACALEAESQAGAQPQMNGKTFYSNPAALRVAAAIRSRTAQTGGSDE